jgi:hypothetical protein
VDVELGGGPYLALTVVTAAGSEGGTYGPTAELRIVTRHANGVPSPDGLDTGDQPDEVRVSAQDRLWIGPAVYPGLLD